MEREHTLFKDLYELREDLGKYIIIIICTCVVQLDLSLAHYTNRLVHNEICSDIPT